MIILLSLSHKQYSKGKCSSPKKDQIQLIVHKTLVFRCPDICPRGKIIPWTTAPVLLLPEGPILDRWSLRGSDASLKVPYKSNLPKTNSN